MRLIIKNKKGILLFEVIVTVVILTAGLTFISHSFSNCIRVLETTQDYNKAIFSAEEALLNLELQKPENWESDGQFKDNPAFTWHQENINREDSGLRDVKLDINWMRRNRAYKLTIATFM